MPSRSKKKFKPVQFDKNSQPKIRLSIRFILWVWILILVAFFLCYLILANFTDSFIVTKNKKTNSNINNQTVAEEQSNSGQTSGNVNPVPQSANKQGNSYLSNCTFVGDAILSGLEKNGVSKNHIKCGPSFVLTNIENSGLTVTDKNLYLMLGYTEIGEQASDALLSKYSSVLSKIKESCPNTKIYIMALPPVADNNTTVLNSAIDDFNSKLLAVANAQDVYYIDTNTILKGNSGSLSSDYYDADGLTDKAYNKITDCILSHTAE